MFNLINKLSNVEQLSCFIKPYNDRVNKMQSLAACLAKLVDLYLADDNLIQFSTEDEASEFEKPFQDLVNDTGDSVIFVDPNTGYTCVMNFIHNEGEPFYGYTCYSDGEGGYHPREYPFLTIAQDDPLDPIYARLDVENLLDSRTNIEHNKVNILDYVSNLEDQINSYNISIDAIKLTIKNRLLGSGDYVAHVKTMYTGLRNGALDLFQSITNALSTHDVSALVGVFRTSMDPSGLTINNDGSVTFPETRATSELNFGAVVAQGVVNLVPMLGQVIATIAKPIGIAIYGLGAIATSATRAIANIADDASHTVIRSDSENVDLALKLTQHAYSYDVGADRLIRNTLASTISDRDFAPHKFEVPGISGYIWPVNFTGTSRSRNTCTMALEAYLSCRGYVSNKDLWDIADALFTITRESYSYSSGYGHAEVRITPKPGIVLESFLELYYSKLQPIDFSIVDSLSSSDKDNLYQKCLFSDAVALTLLYALMDKIDDQASNGILINVPINNNHPYPESQSIHYDVFCVGVQFLCDPFHSAYVSYPMICYDSDHSWVVNANYATGYESYNEVQCQKISTAIDTYGVNDYFIRIMCDNVYYIEHNALDLLDPSDGLTYDCSFQFFPLEQRFAFRMEAPKFTRRSIIFSLVVTGVIIAAVAAITVIATVKINKWRQKKQLEIQTATEAAWDRCKSDPSEANLKAYRKAVTKQNTIGKLYGCSKVSKTNYWASTDSEPANPSNTDPINSSNEYELYKIITGSYPSDAD